MSVVTVNPVGRRLRVDSRVSTGSMESTRSGPTDSPPQQHRTRLRTDSGFGFAESPYLAEGYFERPRFRTESGFGMPTSPYIPQWGGGAPGLTESDGMPGGWGSGPNARWPPDGASGPPLMPYGQMQVGAPPLPAAPPPSSTSMPVPSFTGAPIRPPPHLSSAFSASELHAAAALFAAQSSASGGSNSSSLAPGLDAADLLAGVPSVSNLTVTQRIRLNSLLGGNGEIPHCPVGGTRTGAGLGGYPTDLSHQAALASQQAPSMPTGLQANRRPPQNQRNVGPPLFPSGPADGPMPPASRSGGQAAPSLRPSGGGLALPTSGMAATPAPTPGKTTVMLRNLPDGFTRDALLQLLDSEGFSGKYDFAYLPVDFDTLQGLKHAFVNMITPEEAERLREHLEGFTHWFRDSASVCAVAWNDRQQGLTALIDRYRNSPVMHDSVPDACKPIIIVNGRRAMFPAPTQKIKAPKILKGRGAAGGGQHQHQHQHQHHRQ